MEHFAIHKPAKIQSSLLCCGNVDSAVYFYHSDHLGSASWITNGNGNPVQHLQYMPYGEPFVNERTSSSSYEERYTFTGKERDLETGFSYFGARYYDSDLMTGWLSVDPMADKYPSLSPYAYCAWNPVKLVDPDGESPRIYVETSGLFGHAFVTIGSGKNTIVYTYGRYAELGKDKSSSRGTTPTGEGVLIKLEGEEAMQYINKQINSNDASVFEFKNASDELVGKYFDKKLNDSNKVPKIGKYANAENAKVVDEYNLLTNNCVTTSVDGIQVGMQEKTILDMLISPNDLKDFLNIMSLLSTNVRKIEHNEVRKELNF